MLTTRDLKHSKTHHTKKGFLITKMTVNLLGQPLFKPRRARRLPSWVTSFRVMFAVHFAFHVYCLSRPEMSTSSAPVSGGSLLASVLDVPMLVNPMLYGLLIHISRALTPDSL